MMIAEQSGRMTDDELEERKEQLWDMEELAAVTTLEDDVADTSDADDTADMPDTADSIGTAIRQIQQ